MVIINGILIFITLSAVATLSFFAIMFLCYIVSSFSKSYLIKRFDNWIENIWVSLDKRLFDGKDIKEDKSSYEAFDIEIESRLDKMMKAREDYLASLEGCSKVEVAE